jgi:hypothetical protein
MVNMWRRGPVLNEHGFSSVNLSECKLKHGWFDDRCQFDESPFLGFFCLSVAHTPVLLSTLDTLW